MIRMSIYTISTALVLLSASMGCAPEGSDASVLILYNKAPETGCKVSSSEDGSFITRGLIDTQAWLGYVFTPLVINYAATSNYVDEEQRLAFIEGADVSLATEGDAVGGYQFSTLFSAIVFPDRGTTGVAFEIIPPSYLDQVQNVLGASEYASIRATIRLFGTMNGGEFTSQEYVYWVEACNGCLINNLGACENVTNVENYGGYCNPLQDSAVDCCTDAAGALKCPASTPQTPSM